MPSEKNNNLSLEAFQQQFTEISQNMGEMLSQTPDLTLLEALVPILQEINLLMAATKTRAEKVAAESAALAGVNRLDEDKIMTTEEAIEDVFAVFQYLEKFLQQALTMKQRSEAEISFCHKILALLKSAKERLLEMQKLL